MDFQNYSIAFLLLLISGGVFEASDSESLADYNGTYEFEDGIRVTGGRFDEAGDVMLLYLDTETVARGGAFIRDEGGFKDKFGNQELSFEGQGDRMRWQTYDGKTLLAHRIMKPVTRAAQFANGDIELAGPLYQPPVEGPFPAVVLAHGSGPVNRHAGAWTGFFLEQGFAVLGFDKRGVGGSTGDWRQATYRELAGDVGAALAWLKAQPNIDKERIGLSATSQSGWYAPAVVLKNPSVAFLLQRAAPAVNVGIGTNHERWEEWQAEGLPGDITQKAADFRLALHEFARAGGSREAAQARLEKARQQDWFEPAFGSWQTVEQGWWRQITENMQLEPAKDAGRLRIPVLWFLAEHDENVPYGASMKALDKAKQQNPDLVVVTIADAGHSFLVRDANGNMQYTDGYWQVMARWLAEHGFSSEEYD